MLAVDWRWCLEAGEDAGAPRVGLSRLGLVAKSCSFSNKNCEALSHNVAAFRFVEIGDERKSIKASSSFLKYKDPNTIGRCAFGIDE